MNLNFDKLQNILPLLNNKDADFSQVINMLGNNNPNIASIMQILPLLQNTHGRPEGQKRKKNFDEFVKVDDFYKHKSY